jgi:hypothetical protein
MQFTESSTEQLEYVSTQVDSLSTFIHSRHNGILSLLLSRSHTKHLLYRSGEYSYRELAVVFELLCSTE